MLDGWNDHGHVSGTAGPGRSGALLRIAREKASLGGVGEHGPHHARARSDQVQETNAAIQEEGDRSWRQ